MPLCPSADAEGAGSIYFLKQIAMYLKIETLRTLPGYGLPIAAYSLTLDR
jgi:hypothetical protein